MILADTGAEAGRHVKQRTKMAEPPSAHKINKIQKNRENARCTHKLPHKPKILGRNFSLAILL